ncbi:MAG: hypothetical protein ACI8PD_000551 [Nitrospinales bacterium]
MHTVYKAISQEEMDRILAYCKQHAFFEIYPGEEGSQKTVIVNSRQENEPLENFKPLGSFYCNYLGEGIISLDQDESDYDSMPSAQKHVAAIKQVVDILIEKAHPGAQLQFPV